MTDYHVILLAPNRSKRASELAACVRARCVDLGLAPGCVSVVVNPPTGARTSANRVVAYFGGDSRDHEATSVAEEMVHAGRLILPIVKDLKQFQRHVPGVLHGINGFRDDGTDLALDRMAGLLLEGLGLVRERRRVFISYSRKASTGVANQLFTALHASGFQVFLDTQSVRAGLMFQRTLWDSMSDTDLVVFLDTEGALASRWVAAEFARAIDQGTTLLHIVWPNWSKVHQTGLSEVRYLSSTEFLKSTSHDHACGRLRHSVLDEIVALLERLRAKAFAVRRARLVESFVRCADRRFGTIALQTDGTIEIPGRTAGPARILPIVGVPESRDFQKAQDVPLSKPGVELRVLYRSEGLHVERLNHLRWLDEHLPVKGLRVEEAAAWLASR